MWLTHCWDCSLEWRCKCNYRSLFLSSSLCLSVWFECEMNRRTIRGYAIAAQLLASRLLYLRNLFYCQRSKQIPQLAAVFVGIICWSLCSVFRLLVCLFVSGTLRALLSVGKQNLFVNKAVTSLRPLSLLLSPITHAPLSQNGAKIVASRYKLALLLLARNK